MKYACDMCGACCGTFPVLVSDEDAAREPRIAACALKRPEWLSILDEPYQLHPLPFLDSCTFLDESCRCRIYETRPSVCRAFEPGTPECTEARRRKGLAPLVGE